MDSNNLKSKVGHIAKTEKLSLTSCRPSKGRRCIPDVII